MSDQQVPSSKPINKESSYTYWVDDKNKSRDLPPEHQPKKIQTPIAKTISSENGNSGGSAWNSCGTWEQKKILLKDIESSLTLKVSEWLEKLENNSLILEDVKIQGQAHKIFKKNKWVAMYEIKGSIEFKVQEKLQKQEKIQEEQKEGEEKEVKKKYKKGKVKFLELTDQGDREYELKGDLQVKKKLGNGEMFVKMLEEIIKN